MVGCSEPPSFKIGFTACDPRKRLKQLQTGSPVELNLIGWYPGTPADERDLHEQLAPWWILGEWFRLSREAEHILRLPVTAIRINNMLTGHQS